ncbi:MAG: undecaprenyl-phosphate alpha-N-acetylglucosaminyl 1-phosphate transferase [Armatimonadetes bacterium CG_4_9_14_3_um_filter_58_7]|nr:MAG: undecaprenyl-phosphate alpha-N-acetylglucosaminyl 1-phosphate transferase [Armatimonadetes bacterium CG_4_9_14_3_um_filter_58_7]
MYLAILIACVVEFVVRGNFIGLHIALVGSILVVVGFIDDTRDMRPLLKLSGQILAAVVLWVTGVRILGIAAPFGSGYHHFDDVTSLLTTVAWTVGITNTINLIDGLDGLAAGVTAIAAATLCLMALQKQQSMAVAPVAAAICGASTGFLRYNFNPAKIFMGDTGSQLLGFMLAAIAIAGTFKNAATIAVVVPVLVLGVPVFDTTFAIIRRAVHGKPIFTADRGHLHHRLLDRGLSHKQVVMVLYLVTLILCAAAYALSRMS